jgi:hypothetical protein
LKFHDLLLPGELFGKIKDFGDERARLVLDGWWPTGSFKFGNSTSPVLINS